MAESDAVRISREYREQLIRNEDAALKRISRYWAQMERETWDNYLLLAQEVSELQLSGQAVPIQYIYTLERHRKMLEQLNVLVPQYEHQALDIIEETQRINYTLGLDSANAIIQASHPADDRWTRIHQDAAEAMAGYASNGAPLAELLQTDYGAMASRITDALVSGVGLGKGYKQVAKEMRDAAGMDFKRSVMIARTETNRAYRQANADQYRKSGVVEKVLRLCAMSGSCAACIIMDGWECPNGICDDHPNGKCTTVVVTTGGIMPQWQHGADWLAEQSEEDQRKILGEGRFDLWKNYGVPLEEMVTMKENPVWGGSPAMKTFDMMGYGMRGSKLRSTEKEPEAEKNARKNQPTSVNWDYVNNPEYHEKFKGLTGNEDVDESLYKKALDILKHRQNSDMEDLYLIDSRNGKVVGAQTHSKNVLEVDYNKSLRRAVAKNPDQLISLHNHPNSLPPSGSDFMSNLKHKYKMGIVVSHSGDIYVYNNRDRKLTARNIDSIIDYYPSSQWDELFAELTKEFNITWKKL